jgi:hypothetical protein
MARRIPGFVPILSVDTMATPLRLIFTKRFSTPPRPFMGMSRFTSTEVPFSSNRNPLVDNYGTYNNTYSFNWQNGNNYDPYTGAYFGGNTTTGTYYDVPLPYYTNGLSGVGADSNYFLSYTGTSILLQNPLAQYWGSNQSYNYFTIPDVTNTVQLVFYPAAGSNGCYEVTSNNVIHQTAPYATGWTACAFLAQATQYVDGVLTLLSPSPSHGVRHWCLYGNMVD